MKYISRKNVNHKVDSIERDRFLEDFTFFYLNYIQLRFAWGDEENRKDPKYILYLPHREIGIYMRFNDYYLLNTYKFYIFRDDDAVDSVRCMWAILFMEIIEKYLNFNYDFIIYGLGGFVDYDQLHRFIHNYYYLRYGIDNRKNMDDFITNKNIKESEEKD